MKIYNVEAERQLIGRKPKNPKLDHFAVAKIGKAIYHRSDVTDVTIKIGFKNGTSIAFHRCEDEDEYEARKRKMEEEHE